MVSIPYPLVVGSLISAIMYTRSDIAHLVGIMRKIRSNLRKETLKVVKYFLRYLKGKSKVWVCYRRGDPILESYTNVDMAEDLNIRKFISYYLYTFTGKAML